MIPHNLTIIYPHSEPSQAPPVAPCPLRAAWLRVAARTVAVAVAVAGLRTAKALEAARSMACDAEFFAGAEREANAAEERRDAAGAWYVIDLLWLIQCKYMQYNYFFT